MRVLVACEYSGIVRDAFRARGHDAISCDLRPTLQGGPHAQGDVRAVLQHPWDLVIAHPPCTYLNGIGWLKCTKPHERYPRAHAAAEFFMACLNANAPRVCVENPPMAGWIARSMPDNQDSVAPWQHGHASTKRYHFWLKGLPPLMATSVHPLRISCFHNGTISKLLGRSDTFYPGIARAMAEQWG